MQSFQMLHRRVERTREWLNSFTENNNDETLTEDYDFLEAEDTGASDFGVESLSERTFSQTSSGEEAPHLLSESSGASSWSCESCGDYAPHEISYEYQRAHAIDSDRLDARQAIDYELAGRSTDNTFFDLRSGSKARKRWQRQKDKYWGWRVDGPGLAGKQVYNDCRWCKERCTCRWHYGFGRDPLKKDQAVTVTKTMLFVQARFARPLTFNRSTKGKVMRQAFWPAWVQRAAKERKHAPFNIEEMFDDTFDDELYADITHIRNGFRAGDDLPAFLNDRWDWVRHENFCYICEVPWGHCAGGFGQYEVDQIDSLTFEAAADGQSWKLSWHAQLAPKPNRAPAVLPYGKDDWIGHNYRDCFRHDDYRLETGI